MIQHRYDILYRFMRIYTTIDTPGLDKMVDSALKILVTSFSEKFPRRSVLGLGFIGFRVK